MNSNDKEILLDLLSKETEQVIAIAYVYAKNIELYGIDITKVWDTTTENASAMEKAYQRGYVDGYNCGVNKESDDIFS